MHSVSDLSLRKLAGVAVASSLMLAAHALYAQPASTTAPASDDETVKLSEFTVSSKSTTGYTANESMTGTRVATQIKDLPFSINVVTNDFLEDFGMFQIDDTLTQIGGLTSIDIGGGFTLRGFSSSSQLRDGFYRLGRYGQTNIDRIEIIKGPNAGIYGRTSPGGMINMISKAPKKAELEKLTLTFGDYKTERGILETTGPLTPDKKTYYIMVVSQFSRGFNQKGLDVSRIHENQAFLAVKHDFADNSHLLVSAEYFLQYRHAPTNSAPVIYDAHGTASTASTLLNGALAVGYDKSLAKYSANGPFSELNRGSITFLAVYDKRISDLWSLRVGLQDFRARRWDYNQDTSWAGIVYNSTATTSGAATVNNLEQRGTTIRKGMIQEDGGGVQIDNVFNYRLFNDKVANKTLVTIDLNDYYRWDPTRDTLKDANYNAWAAGNGLQNGRSFYVTPGTFAPAGPIGYYRFPFQFGQLTNSLPYQRATKRRTTVLGGLLRQEDHWFNDHLLTYFGFRIDEARFLERDYVNKAGAHVRRYVYQFKPNIGALYKVTDNFRVYGNYSESYFVNQTDNPSDIASATYAPETAKGFDYGIKGSFFNDRLNYTIGGYYIKRNNVRVTDSLEISPGVFQDTTRADGNQLDRGWEADVNWQVTDSINFLGSFGHVNALTTSNGSKFPEAAGRQVQNIAPENGSASIKWSPKTGMLKGFSANIQATFVTKTPTESPTQGDNISTVGGPHVAFSTNQWALKMPGYTIWNLGLHYNLNTNVAAKLSHTFSLNVNNVFDKDYLKIGKNYGDRRAFYFTYTLGFSAFGL